MKESFKYFFLSIFPDYFHNYFNISIANKALKKGIIDYETIDIRDFSSKGAVDDYVYGGGKGMLMRIDVVFKAIEFVKRNNKDLKVIYLSPQGQKLNQKKVEKLSKIKKIALLCGRYEGIDSRIDNFIDMKISIGDYICSGGELPSLVLVDSLIRSIPGVIKDHSYLKETFSSSEKKGFKECDLYTRPSNFNGYLVPSVLLSGNFKEISKWKKENSISKMKRKKIK